MMRDRVPALTNDSEGLPTEVQRVTYYYVTVHDRPGEAYRLLSTLAGEGVNLLAFSAVPMGGDRTQLVLFPEEVDRLAKAAEVRGLELSGPENALLCRGDDKLGAFADIHRRLYDANINVYAASGVTADCGRFGYLIYVRANKFEEAARVLGV